MIILFLVSFVGIFSVTLFISLKILNKQYVKKENT